MTERLIAFTRRRLPRWLWPAFDQLVLSWRATKLVDGVWDRLASDDRLRRAASTIQFCDADERAIVEGVRGLRVYWVAIGGTIDTSVWASHAFEYPRDFVGFHLAELAEKLRQKPDRWQIMERLAGDQIVTEVRARALRILQHSGYELSADDPTQYAFEHAARDAGLRVCLWRDPEVKAYNEDENWYSHVIARFSIGMIVTNPAQPAEVSSP